MAAFKCDDWAYKFANKTPGQTFCFRAGSYNLFNTDDAQFQACYEFNRLKGDSPWYRGPMTNFLPYLVIQLAIIILTYRLLLMLFRPLYQPILVSAILGGIMLGATMFAQFPDIAVELFPFNATVVLETVSNLGITYYMFLVGLEMDLAPLLHVGFKPICIALAGIFPPFIAGLGSYYLFTANQVHKNDEITSGHIFWGISLTLTSFPDVARLLSDLKLMQTDFGKTALISGLLNDIISWSGLVISLTLFNKPSKYKNTVAGVIGRLVPTLLMVPFFWLCVRPFVHWLVKLDTDLKPSAENENSATSGNYTDFHICSIITAVALFGLLTDACGSHSMVGAFLLGLVIPPGELGTLIMEKTEEFVTGILLPAFFLSNGLRINIPLLLLAFTNPRVFNMTKVYYSIAISFSIKIISTWAASLLLGSRNRDGLALGLLMNTKGVLAIIVINLGRNLLGFDQYSFCILTLIFLLMTSTVGPLIMLFYRPAKQLKHYKQRCLERSTIDSELRVITCVHSSRNAASIIKVLLTTSPTRKSPLFLYPLRLVELTGRAKAAMLIVHDHLKSQGENTEEDVILGAFQDLEHGNTGGFIIQPLTIVSPYDSMHQDIVSVASDKSASVIIMPFHKQATSDGMMEDGNINTRQVNLNILENAPCSVALLVDRGLASLSSTNSLNNGRPNLRIGMLFIGGADDREALALAWRMSRKQGVVLTVLRILPGKQAAEKYDDKSVFENQLDDAYVNGFRFKAMINDSVMYMERQVNETDEALEVIKSTYNEFDLYVVGRGRDRASPLTAGLEDWCENPELGAIGDILVQSEDVPSSVLVVQQYIYAAPTHNASEADLAFVNHRKKDDDDFY